MNDTTTCTICDPPAVTLPADIPGLVTFTHADPGTTINIGGARVAVLYFATIDGGSPAPVIDVKEG